MWSEAIFMSHAREIVPRLFPRLADGHATHVRLATEAGGLDITLVPQVREDEQGGTHPILVAFADTPVAAPGWVAVERGSVLAIPLAGGQWNAVQRLVRSFAHLTQGPADIYWLDLPDNNRPPLTIDAPVGPYRITAAIRGGASYAMAHNRLSPLQELWVTPASDAPDAEALEVSVSLETGLERSPCGNAVVQIPPGAIEGPVRLRVNLNLDASVMSTLDEAVGGELVVHVTGTRSGSHSFRCPIDLLAYNEWAGLAGLHQTLASFVQPNHPAVKEVLKRASRLLLEQTGDAALQGYQYGSQRASQIAAAIYEALREREITYIDPPASFENGQRIRMPEEVIGEGFGTCLDTTVVYAACLEAAGLRPVLFLIHGHAFSGLLTSDTYLPSELVTDPSRIINAVESGLVLPVETTTITAGTISLPFLKAVEQGRHRATGRPEILESLIDVKASRSTIRPLPIRRSGEAAALEQQAEPETDLSDLTGLPTTRPTESAASAEATPTARAGSMPADTSPLRVRQWKRALLDLSLRNQLLNFKNRPADIEFVLPSKGLHAFEDRVAMGYKHTLYANDQLSELQREQGLRAAQQMEAETLADMLFNRRILFTTTPEETYGKTLRSLRRKARSLEEETGANHLFLTLGELRWTDNGKPESEGGKPLRSPLLLVPARLDGGVKGKPLFSFHIEEGGYAVPNYSLLEKLKVTFGLEIPELMTPLTDDAGVDVDAVIASVRTALVDADLPFRVEESGFLALLSFTSFRLWKDLDEHQSALSSAPVVNHLIHTPAEPFADPNGTHDLEVDESKLVLPLPADGSQMKAVAWASAGRSFVLEGPPGTGKSQTITNLMAQLISDGKSVLFVAEKQPALEVVQRRLAAVGLGPMTLNLHGKSQSPAQIRASIKESLNLSAEGSEALWHATRGRIDAAISRLAGYPKALHSTNEAGYSVWTARETLLALGEGPVADIPTSHIGDHGGSKDEIRSALADLPPALQVIGDPGQHPWRSSRLSDPDAIDARALSGAVAELDEALQSCERDAALLAPLWGDARSASTLRAIADLAPAVARGVAPTSSQLASTEIHGWADTLAQWAARVEEYSSRTGSTRARYDRRVMALDLDGLKTAASEGATRMLGRKRHMRVVKEQLRPFVNDGHELALEVLIADLTELIADRDEGRTLTEQVKQIAMLPLPADWTVWKPAAADDIRAAVAALDLVNELVSVLPQTSGFLDRLASTGARSNLATGQAILRVVAAWENLVQTAKLDPGFFGGDRPLIDDIRDLLPLWREDAGNSLLQLRRWVRLEQVLKPLRRTGLNDFVSQLLQKAIPAEESDPAFQRGLAARSIEERLSATGLDRFDAVTHDGAAAKYIHECDSLREQMKSMLPARHLEATAATRKTAGHGLLSREVAKTRSRTSIRTLLERHGREVQQAVPCFLMSPDSVARLLNPEKISFDVVVFDEASQIKVAEAIGALGRGTSAIVVGDSRQMPPTSFAQTNLDDDEELVETSVIPKDEESILSEAVQAGLPQLWLSWHYRSQDESLIAFSNRNYYDGRLASFPGPRTGDPERGVHLRQVDGVFERGSRRINQIEAKAIVQEVIARLNNPATAGESIGVVTFNKQQQELVSDLLETSGDERVLEAMSDQTDPADRLFVKNLESVQGDERDVILFSLAFSRDARGKLPLNFGPLVQTGGERRLNVAITRARKLVMLFCSFKPSDMDLKGSSSVGLAHLKSYLELAQANSLGESLSSRTAISGRDLHREEIAAALAERGLRVETQIGLSDFTVDIAVARAEDKDWRTAVLLDGPGWARRTTVADRDGFPLSVLAGPMGWSSVSRVWLPAWLTERERILDDIEALVTSGEAEQRPMDEPDNTDHAPGQNDMTAPDGSSEGPARATSLREEPQEQVAPEGGTGRDRNPVSPIAPAAPVSPPVHTDMPEVDHRGTPAAAYASTAVAGSAMPSAVRSADDIVRTAFAAADASEIAGTWVLDTLHDRTSRERVRQALEQAIAEEGPIEKLRLVRTVGRRFGMHRMRAARADAVAELIPASQLKAGALGSFVWPEALRPDDYNLLRTQDSPTVRPISEIAPEELLNSALWVLRSGSPMPEEALVRSMLLEFGQIRLTAPSRSRMLAVLERGVGLGLLEHGPGDRWRLAL